MNFIVVLILLNFYLVNSSFLTDLKENEKTSEYIGNLINQWNKIDPGVHDIQIFKSKIAKNDGKIVSDFVDTLLKSIPDENVVFIRDLNTDAVNDTLRPGAFKIIVSDPVEMV
jgi:hypothetical protein